MISIETLRSKMELLEAYATYAYPDEIGPGVYVPVGDRRLIAPSAGCPRLGRIHIQ